MAAPTLTVTPVPYTASPAGSEGRGSADDVDGWDYLG